MEEILYEYAWLIPVLPLLGAAGIGFGLISFNTEVNRLRQTNALLILHLLGVAVALSFALFWSQFQGHEPYVRTIEWASAGDFHLTMGYTIDHLTTLMLVVVTTVALLVMIYTDGYMSHDPGYVRFYAYLSLFSSSMLGLVMSPNLVQIYIFWELVGMCSYLLVGFWFDRKAAADACQKAFVTNRVGDFGLLLGMLGLFWATGSFDFETIGSGLQNAVTSGTVPGWAAVALCLFVFMGPMAKSAHRSPSGCPMRWRAPRRRVH